MTLDLRDWIKSLIFDGDVFFVERIAWRAQINQMKISFFHFFYEFFNSLLRYSIENRIQYMVNVKFFLVENL